MRGGTRLGSTTIRDTNRSTVRPTDSRSRYQSRPTAGRSTSTAGNRARSLYDRIPSSRSDARRGASTSTGRLADRYRSSRPTATTRTNSTARGATPSIGNRTARGGTTPSLGRADHRYTRPNLGSRVARGGVKSAVGGVAPSLGRRLATGSNRAFLSHNRIFSGGSYRWSRSYWGCNRWGFWGSYTYWPSYCLSLYSPFAWSRYTHYYPSYSYSYDYCWWPGRRTYIPVSWYGGYGYADGYGGDVIINIDGDTALAGDPGYDSGAVAPSAADAEPPSTEGLATRFVGLGDFYFKEGRFADAADSYARARTYAPEDPTIHFVLADALFATGDYHFAAFLIGEAVQLDPAIARAVADKRTFYGDPEDFERQMATLVKYLEDKPYDAAAHFVYGYNLFFSERVAESQKAFERVIEIEPGHIGAEAFLASANERLAAPAPSADESGK